MKPSISPKIYSTLLLYAAGFAVGYVVIFLDYQFSSTEPRHYQFLHYYQSQLWLLLLIMQTVFWFAVCVPIYRIIIFLKSEYHARREKLLNDKPTDGREKEQATWRGWKLWRILAGLLFLTIGYLLLHSSSFLSPNCGDYSFLHSSWKTLILNIIGFGIALIAATALLLISIELAALERGGLGAGRVSKYITLRRYSLRLLTILGAMTSLATVAFGAKRNTIQAMKDANLIVEAVPCEFLREHIFLYALYLSMLLALAFFPTYAALLRTGRKLVCDLLPMPPPSDELWLDWYSRQKTLEELLQLSVTENLRAGIAILAPIAGSLISLVK